MAGVDVVEVSRREVTREETAELAEEASLIRPPAARAEQPPRDARECAKRRRWRWRLSVPGATALLVSALAVGLLVVWRTLRRCRLSGVREAGIVLYGAADADLLSLEGADGHGDAVQQWLAATQVAGDRAEVAGGEVDVEAQAAVEAAMDAASPAEAKQVVRRAVDRALSKWRVRRRDLQRYLQGNRTRLPKSTTPSPKAQALTAKCVINVLQTSTALASLAVNINDALKTCPGAKLYGRNSSSRPVCALNFAGIFGTLLNVALGLSSAAAACADTLIPNVDAACATSILFLIRVLPTISGSLELIYVACREPAFLARKFHVHKGATPSNIGQPGTPGEFTVHVFTDKVERRRLAEPASGGPAADEGPGAGPDGTSTASSAPPRQLLFGGGKDADATFCGLDIATMAWQLAQAGLRLNSAVNKDAGASCPPKGDLAGPLGKFPGIAEDAHRISQGFCAVDILGFLETTFFAVSQIALAFLHCSDSLNTRGLCASGISGFVGILAAIGEAGSGIWLMCQVFQRPALKKLLLAFRHLDLATRGRFSGDLRGWIPETLSASAGRRLRSRGAGEEAEEEEDEPAAELRRKFASPADVWRSIGFDIEDESAAWRKAARTLSPDPPPLTGSQLDSLTSLLADAEAAEREEERTRGSLAGQEACS